MYVYVRVYTHIYPQEVDSQVRIGGESRDPKSVI